MNDKEIWKNVIGYNNIYQINNFGKIKSLKRKAKRKVNFRQLKEKILKPKIHPKGYLYIGLHKNSKTKTYKIHRLVAQHFILNLENKPQVNHKDGVKSNNNVDNLEWVTNSENIQHGMKLFGKHHYASMLGKKGIKSPLS